MKKFHVTFFIWIGEVVIRSFEQHGEVIKIGTINVALNNVPIQHNVPWEAMMLEHMGEEQPSRFLGRNTFLGGNEVCHLAKSINHHHDGIKAP